MLAAVIFMLAVALLALLAHDETLAKDATFLRQKVERYPAWQRERVERALARDKHADAMGELLVFEVRFAKMDVISWALEQIKALAKEAKGVATRGARNSVLFAYGKVVKSHGGSAAAKIARERRKALGAK